VARIDVWEFRPPPGSFLYSSEGRSTILWPPDIGDGDRTCWQKTSGRELRSKPFVWTGGQSSSYETDRRHVFRVLFCRTHDDHSALALLVGRDRRRRARESRRTRDRSSSMPPPGAGDHEGNHCFFLFGTRFGLPRKEIVITRLHKCPFDSQWGFDVPGNPGRACMKGCQGRTDYSSLFEEFLEDTALRPKRIASELERIGRIVEVD
jgi:hypothetical protein